MRYRLLFGFTGHLDSGSAGAQHVKEFIFSMTSKILAASVFLAASLSCFHAVAEDDDSPLERNMAAMNSSFKVLAKQVSDPQKSAASLELVDKMKKAATAARDCRPEMAAEIPEAERAKFLGNFSEAITDLLGQIDELKSAVKEGRIADAQKMIDEIKESKREGHSTFINKKDKD